MRPILPAKGRLNSDPQKMVPPLSEKVIILQNGERTHRDGKESEGLKSARIPRRDGCVRRCSKNRVASVTVTHCS
jgi:hypothetical protein